MVAELHYAHLMLLIPQRWEQFVKVIVMGDSLEHTTVTGGAVVVAVTGDIMENTKQRKKIHYIKFLWLKIGIPQRKSNCQYPWGQGTQQHLVHNIMDI